MSGVVSVQEDGWRHLVDFNMGWANKTHCGLTKRGPWVQERPAPAQSCPVCYRIPPEDVHGLPDHLSMEDVREAMAA